MIQAYINKPYVHSKAGDLWMILTVGSLCSVPTCTLLSAKSLIDGPHDTSLSASIWNLGYARGRAGVG